MAIMIRQQPRWTPFPTGVYTLKVLRVSEAVSADGRDFFRWEFEIQDNLPPEVMDGHKRPTFGQGTNRHLTERNNLDKLLDIMGFEIQVGERFDTARAVGHVFVARVNDVEKPDGTRDNRIEHVSLSEYKNYMGKSGGCRS
jgi:hypothetical protein